MYVFGKYISSDVWNNNEIKKEYIEEYVLTELEARIFSNKEIPILLKALMKS